MIYSNNLKQILLTQLKHYQKLGGQRLYTLTKLTQMLGLKSKSGVREKVQKILKDTISPLCSNMEKAKTVYEMILGRVGISFQKVKQSTILNGFILKTSPTEWFKMVQNRKGTPSNLKVDIICQFGHNSNKKVDTLINTIRKGTRTGCSVCRDINLDKAGRNNNLKNQISLQVALQLANTRGFKLVSFKDPDLPLSQSEFNGLLILNKKLGERNREVVLRWKHIKCNHGFESSYRNIKAGHSNCGFCYSSTDQKVTHSIAEYIFGNYLPNKCMEADKPLQKIFPKKRYQSLLDLGGYKLQNLTHPSCHVDIFGILLFNGRRIKLAIEHQGIQHNKIESIGVQAFINLAASHGINLSYVEAKKKWKSMLLRDEEKVILFDSLKSEDYFLIQVPHTIKKRERFKFIADKIETLTEIKVHLKLNNLPDWRSLLK